MEFNRYLRQYRLVVTTKKAVKLKVPIPIIVHMKRVIPILLPTTTYLVSNITFSRNKVDLRLNWTDEYPNEHVIKDVIHTANTNQYYFLIYDKQYKEIVMVNIPDMGDNSNISNNIHTICQLDNPLHLDGWALGLKFTSNYCKHGLGILDGVAYNKNNLPHTFEASEISTNRVTAKYASDSILLSETNIAYKSPIPEISYDYPQINASGGSISRADCYPISLVRSAFENNKITRTPYWTVARDKDNVFKFYPMYQGADKAENNTILIPG